MALRRLRVTFGTTSPSSSRTLYVRSSCSNSTTPIDQARPWPLLSTSTVAPTPRARAGCPSGPSSSCTMGSSPVASPAISCSPPRWRFALGPPAPTSMTPAPESAPESTPGGRVRRATRTPPFFRFRAEGGDLPSDLTSALLDRAAAASPSGSSPGSAGPASSPPSGFPSAERMSGTRVPWVALVFFAKFVITSSSPSSAVTFPGRVLIFFPDSTSFTAIQPLSITSITIPTPWFVSTRFLRREWDQFLGMPGSPARCAGSGSAYPDAVVSPPWRPGALVTT
mmetsp:Transcript_6911/g.15833  ORF Transcript_6911/g.15833 Transcript_6911/m.15833 type:complete len:282 (+) Transcript_6911:153-998(+)